MPARGERRRHWRAGADRAHFIGLVEEYRPAVEIVQGVRLFCVKQPRYRGSSGVSYVFAYFRFLCAVTLKLARLFRRERYDVVYVHTMPDLVVIAGLIPKLFGAKIGAGRSRYEPELFTCQSSESQRSTC